MTKEQTPIFPNDIDSLETEEWMESLDYVLEQHGPERARYLLNKVKDWAVFRGVKSPLSPYTPYINTILPEEETEYPGDESLEETFENWMRWNAMAMVVRANKKSDGVGGHIATYASISMMFEMGFNHFFRAKTNDSAGDRIFYQAHACPGIYARSFLEGRLTEKNLENFRRELSPEGGLSSYPHPWLMPDYWEYPSVSMGLAPITAIYQARFNRYLTNRGIKDVSASNVWAFIGDGETDEPETLGAIRFAGREKLDNLTFIVNCNLQRLDGPVCGNGKIIQELEGSFRGANWNVIKVIWGQDWDELFSRDERGLLAQRMTEVLDGEYQKYKTMEGSYIRESFFGSDPYLLDLVKDKTDEELQKLSWGGHDRKRLYNAYKMAQNHKGQPTVILVKSVKGYKLGSAGEAMNVAHQQKKMTEEQLLTFRDRLNLDLSDEDALSMKFIQPKSDSREVTYMRERRENLGGSLPARTVFAKPLQAPPLSAFKEFLDGTNGREVSTTMAFVRVLGTLLKDKNIGKRVVPIVPDEARTFGIDALFRQVGIFSSKGQLYTPVDKNNFLYYKESTDGQILQEGINEAGAMASFIAAGSSYMAFDEYMIPFYVYYSMFGFQRVGDSIWMAADTRTKGFLLGATAGRTTLNGEGLQHEDGHSHVQALTVPNLKAYDPTFAYEIAVIVREGIYRMYEKGDDIFYYLTLQNENYAMPEMPENAEDGIIRGCYCWKRQPSVKKGLKAHLLGSGSIMQSVIKAADILRDKYEISTDIWSVTSYKELRNDALEVERWNRLNPSENPKKSYVQELFKEEEGVFLAASDYMKILPDGIRSWMPKNYTALGTDGFGMSASREELRRYFEVDAECIVLGVLAMFVEKGDFSKDDFSQAIKDLGVDPGKRTPFVV
ncbi:pyruvate dehydrogenase (acetyl-transferring), homodimeric type [PVC group bacterium (ex Bugula neritina AB1)]|nr:pyruvate dehydrogenase (acetyl-transferring), homodimeric type [PVC group bacterium (ex Bugula neritina AB1)]